MQAADRPGVQEVKQATCSGTSAVAIARPQCLNGREIAARRETMTDGCHRTKAANSARMRPRWYRWRRLGLLCDSGSGAQMSERSVSLAALR